MATTVRPKIRSAFGDILRSDLNEQSVSLKGLARRLAGDGATEEQVNGKRRQLQKYLSGEVAPSEKARNRIAAALDRDPSHFAPEAERRAEMQEIANALVPLADVLHRLAVKAKMRAAG